MPLCISLLAIVRKIGYAAWHAFLPVRSTPLNKIIMLLLLLVAAIQVIKPLGWPGLRKRSDAWKLVGGVVALTIASVILSALFKGI